MNIRINSSSEAIKAQTVYVQNKATPLFDIKTRMLCALEALINMGKALNQHMAIYTNPENKAAKEKRNLYLQRADHLANCMTNPNEYLTKYAATFPKETVQDLVSGVKGVARSLKNKITK